MKSILLLASSLTIGVLSEKFIPTEITAPFLEQFDEGWDSRWKSSEAIKNMPSDYKPGDEDNVEELFRYRGEWSVESAQKDALDGDLGLVAKTPAAHHAISVAFKKPVNPDGKDLVIQYDLKLQDGLQCGGAYIKLLSESKEGIKFKEFTDQTPYTIMFGPDHCGSTNKVHFIFRHQNPKTKEFEEKHLKSPPAIKNDQNTNLYTLVVHPDNKFEVYINQEKVKSGSLLEDFDPPVNPPKEINDPKDEKPEDWVDEAKIPDPKAKKPEDWDEDAPRMIPDEDAKQPEDWLENEPEFIPDPEASKPEDWDDEEDGKWVGPQVPNPKCEKVSGCGKWERPQKPNPEYKGKWRAPMIDNPDYKGVWEPRKIPNPDFFEDLTPSKFNKIMGIGIEIWTMQSNILFDNFYVGHSYDDAKKLADETWKVKRDVEEKSFQELAKKEEAERKEKEAENGNSEEVKEDAPFYAKLQKELQDFIRNVQVDPVKAVTAQPKFALGILALILVPFMSLFGGEKPKAQKKKVETDDKEEEDDADDEKEDKDEKSTTRKRKTAQQ